MKDAERKPALGYLFAILTVMVTAAAFIAAKPVLEYLDPLSMSISQFAFATVFSGVWLVLRRRAGEFRALTPRQWSFLVVVSWLFLASIYTMWIGLARIPATATSLLNRVEVLVIVLLGVALMGDRFSRQEALGAGIMFLGVVVLRYQAPSSFSAGFWMVILSSVLFGITEVVVKAGVHSIPPDVFAFARNLLVFVFFLVAAVWRVFMKEGSWWGGLLDWDGVVRGWPLIATAALVGPFLGRTLYLYALRHLEVSRAALITQTTPLFVAAYSAVLLHTLPSRREWTGGLLILAGSLLLVHWRQGMSWWRAKRENGEPG